MSLIDIDDRLTNLAYSEAIEIIRNLDDGSHTLHDKNGSELGTVKVTRDDPDYPDGWEAHFFIDGNYDFRISDNGEEASLHVTHDYHYDDGYKRALIEFFDIDEEELEV